MSLQRSFEAPTSSAQKPKRHQDVSARAFQVGDVPVARYLDCEAGASRFVTTAGRKSA